MVTHVSDLGSNVNENLETWGKALGRSGRRRKVFNAIYSSQRKQWTGSDLVAATGLGLVAVLHEAQKLAANGLLSQRREDGRNVYQKDARVQHHKRAVLRYADSPSARNALPTKRRPAGTSSHTVRVRVVRQRARARQIMIDAIDSFRKVRPIRVSALLGDSMPETRMRDGVKSILGELGHFADWGGEQHDLFSTNVRIDGKRYAAAFAFKGPATKGALTPGKCGKNGDQIQRLLESPATVFLFQYNRQIAPSVLTQMRSLAELRSMFTNEEVLYGTIDGQDSGRLVAAYPQAFKSVARPRRAAKRKRR